MNEHTEKLRAILEQLHTELESLDSLDTESQEGLRQAAQEIESVLGAEEDTGQRHVIADRLRDFASDFETSHPTLSGILGRLVNGLSEIGI